MDRSDWRSVVTVLAAVLLVAAAWTHLIAAWAYVMGPGRVDQDPTIFVVVAAVLLSPAIALGVVVRRARLVSLQWDLDRTGRNILVVVASLLAAILGSGGLYAVGRYIQLIR